MASSTITSSTINSTMNSTPLQDDCQVRKASPIKRWSSHLLGAVQTKWQKLRHDRQELWRIYNGSAYAHSVPRCVWRRHGAVLMYARYHKPDLH